MKDCQHRLIVACNKSRKRNKSENLGEFKSDEENFLKTSNSHDCIFSDVSPRGAKIGRICDHLNAPTNEEDDEKQKGLEDSINGESKTIKCDLAISHGESDILFHPGFRPSLFKNVPPYVKFAHHDVRNEEFPSDLQELLVWKTTNLTPLVVKRVVANSGYTMTKKSSNYGGTWGKHLKSVSFRLLKNYQKVNHIPGCFQIGRKDRLWINIKRMISKFGLENFNLMPITYILPGDRYRLKLAWNDKEKSQWIIKPPASARGLGIMVVSEWNKIPFNKSTVVQKYVANPYLMDGTKFDLRLYVLITSVNPLKIYIYEKGLTRFASVKYSSEVETSANRYMHLTNYSINKLNSGYVLNDDANACKGHKWSLESTWNHMETELGLDVNAMKASLYDLVVKTILSAESTLIKLDQGNVKSRYNTFELFGVDVLFDETLKPWLLEVNISPSLHSNSALDTAVKGPLVHDVLNMVGYHMKGPNDDGEEDVDGGKRHYGKIFHDWRLYQTDISVVEKRKHRHFSKTSRDQYLESILSDLTPDDVRCLILYEDELSQKGLFVKIFPTQSSHRYFQFIEGSHYYNYLLDAWETKYHCKRREGITLLNELCSINIHLEVAEAAADKDADTVVKDWEQCKCEECGLLFSTLTERMNHYKSEHPGKPLYTCRYCEARHFFLRSSLYKHTTKYHANEAEAHLKKFRKGCLYKCVHCDENIAGLLEYERHGREKHPGSPIFLCKDCGKEFHFRKALKEHANEWHGSLKIKCSYCASCYHSKRRLVQHEELCKKRMEKRMRLRASKPSHFCNICKRNLYMTAHCFRTHVNRHKAYDFCEDCQRGFNRITHPNGLAEHIRLRHPLKENIDALLRTVQIARAMKEETCSDEKCENTTSF